MQTEQNHAPKPATPLVSFIVTYYELPVSMLLTCLKSILALSLSDAEREIIVVDDGSRQSPVADLQAYSDSIVYLKVKHGGLSEARNAGIRMATGRYLQFVDGDDWLIQPPYEHCLDLARYDMADLIQFDFTHEATAVQGVYSDTQPVSGTFFLKHFNLRAMACGYLFKRDLLGDELRFTRGIVHEDEEFTPLLFLRTDRLVTTNAQAYFYRLRDDSIVGARDTRKTLQRLNDMKHVISTLDNQADTLPYEERRALRRRVAQLTMDYIYNIIRQTQSRHYLDRRLAELRRKGLFPLPDEDYTTKYTWFRRLTNSDRGLSLLMRIIPLAAKER